MTVPTAAVCELVTVPTSKLSTPDTMCPSLETTCHNTDQLPSVRGSFGTITSSVLSPFFRVKAYSLGPEDNFMDDLIGDTSSLNEITIWVGASFKTAP